MTLLRQLTLNLVKAARALQDPDSEGRIIRSADMFAELSDACTEVEAEMTRLEEETPKDIVILDKAIKVEGPQLYEFLRLPLFLANFHQQEIRKIIAEALDAKVEEIRQTSSAVVVGQRYSEFQVLSPREGQPYLEYKGTMYVKVQPERSEGNVPNKTNT